MGNFSYTGSGTIRLHGCADVEVQKCFNYLFAIGSIVYDAISARKGVLEQVAIRRVLFRPGNNLYVSSDHELFNEADLCTNAQAIALVTAYYQNKLAEVEDAIADLNC